MRWRNALSKPSATPRFADRLALLLCGHDGFVAGTGKLAGVDPREMARSDLVIIWGIQRR